MSRLVKINNGTQTNGVITVNIAGLELDPYSTVSLLNMSCVMNDKNIEITDQNNRLGVKISNTVTPNPPVYTAVLRVGLYNRFTLAKELSRALNSALLCTDMTCGFQFKVGFTDEKKIKIMFDRIPRGEPVAALTNETVLFRVNMNTDAQGSVYTKTSPDGWNAGFVTRRYFTGGVGNMYIRRAAGDLTNNMIVGLVPFNKADYFKDGNNDDWSINKYHYAVYSQLDATSGTSQYFVKYIDNDGNPQTHPTGVAPTNQERFGFMLSEGRIKFGRVDNDTYFIEGEPTFVPLDPAGGIPWDYTSNYFGAASLFNDGAIIDRGGFFADPFFYVHESGLSHYSDSIPDYNLFSDLEYLNSSISNVGLNTSIVEIQTRNAVEVEARNLLGYPAPIQPSANVQSGQFVADRGLKAVIYSQTLKILFDNLKIESYDSKKRGQESILHTVPYLDNDDGRVGINMPFPLERPLLNISRTNLTTLTVRLVDFDNNLISLQPNLTNISLLFSPKKRSDDSI